MKKNVVKINENTLRQIVAESVENVLKEYTSPDTDGAIYPQNHKKDDFRRRAYGVLGAFKGDKKHKQSVKDFEKTQDKYRRYDAWSEKDGLEHGAPFYVPLLNVMNNAKKMLNNEFSATIDRNPNLTPEEEDFLYDKWHQAMDGLEKSFYEIRNYYKERGTVSDYRGR